MFQCHEYSSLFQGKTKNRLPFVTGEVFPSPVLVEEMESAFHPGGEWRLANFEFLQSIYQHGLALVYIFSTEFWMSKAANWILNSGHFTTPTPIPIHPKMQHFCVRPEKNTPRASAHGVSSPLGCPWIRCSSLPNFKSWPNFIPKHWRSPLQPLKRALNHSEKVTAWISWWWFLDFDLLWRLLEKVNQTIFTKLVISSWLISSQYNNLHEIAGLVTNSTPPKTNKMMGMEDYVPFEMVSFQGRHLLFFLRRYK